MRNTDTNTDILAPLFLPHEEPNKHRAKGDAAGTARIVPHRRPSPLPLVQNLRALVREWRENHYAGASDTTRHLLNHWFGRAHRVPVAGGGEAEFRYYFCQREAVETIIFLKEIRRINTLSQLWDNCGSDDQRKLADGIAPEENLWTRYACKLATGAGKTKVMSLAVVWSYFHALREADSPMARHFVIVAPNIIVFERLREDFRPEGGGENIFDRDPLIPSEWRGDWNLSVVLQDETSGADTGGTLYLTNIHRLYEPAKKRRDAADLQPWAGPAVRRATALDTGAALRERILRHRRVLLLNDEAHHVWDTGSAWHEAIEFFHEKLAERGGALVGQLDFTATPKDNKGLLFKHIICDTPLGEAVDAGIVKTPIIGTAEQGLKNMPAADAGDRYEQHLRLGYERWRKSFEEWKNSGKKPLLFVMCEDTEAANQITRRLQTDPVFSELNDKTLNLHTNLKGKVKKGIFEVSEKDISDDDLKALRRLSRELDSPANPYRCIVSVLMLREGWDVRNVTTIVPLRPLSAKNKVLGEQVLGRGLRRMTPPVGGAHEIVTIVEHEYFVDLYRQELAEAGLDVNVVALDKVPRTTISIYPDEGKKNIAALDIPIPQLAAGAVNIAVLGDIDFKEIKTIVAGWKTKPLSFKKEFDGVLDYEGRHLVTDEVLEKMQLQLPLLKNGFGAISYFVKELELITRLRGAHAKLAPLLQKFITELLFEKPAPVNDPTLLARLADGDARERIRAAFVPVLRKKTTVRQDRRIAGEPALPSLWKHFQVTASENKPAKHAAKTLFNYATCDNHFEAAFVDFLERAGDVAAFVRNAGPQCLRFDYVSQDSRVAFYTPDFIVRMKDGRRFLVETKGRVDRDVPLKAQAACQWCSCATSPAERWEYLYVPQGFFERSNAVTLDDLAGAAAPALADLLNAPRQEQEMPLFAYGAKQAESATGTDGLIDEKLLEALPERFRKAAGDAVDLFRFTEKKAESDYAPAFQPLLGSLDDAAKNYVYARLRDALPATRYEQDAWFAPAMYHADRAQLGHYDRLGKQLKSLMLYQNPTSPVGLLRDCFRLALHDASQLDGVFAIVREKFRFAGASNAFQEIGKVYELRNRCIAHAGGNDIETKKLREDLKQRAPALGHLVAWVNLLRTLTGIPAELRTV